MMWLTIAIGVALVSMARHGSSLLAARLAPSHTRVCRRLLAQRVDCFAWGVVVAALGASPLATDETRTLAPFGGVVGGVIALVVPIGVQSSPPVRGTVLSTTRRLLLAIVAGVAGWLTGATLFGPL